MMALAVPNPPSDRKRVKVYELKNNDWFDRGTGFCTGQLINVRFSYCVLLICGDVCLNDGDRTLRDPPG
jgi:hypothetical protein